MRYRVSMPDPHSHLFRVELEVERPGESLVLSMPVWTPGSYLVREFARHVEGLAAVDEAGRALAIERLDKHRFRVASRGAALITISYSVFAHELSVRTCHLDGTHGYFNGAALLFRVEAAVSTREAHLLEVVPPPGWRVATALPPAPGGSDPFAESALPAQVERAGRAAPRERWLFTASDYDALVDAPVEVGTHALKIFTALGKPHAIAVWGGAVDLERIARDVRRIVEHLGRQMEGLPYARYLFIVHLDANLRGGLEHASSTTLLVRRSGFFPQEAYQDTLALFAHEFFHLWNVKRLRPAAFVPYDYDREQYTRLLWWFEGVTSYYDMLTLARTGLCDVGRYLRHLGEELTAYARLPGADKMNLEESSLTTWVKLYRPDENSGNSAISYYRKGELVALALDLALRRAGASLDALTRQLYRRYAEGGLPEDGVEGAVAEVLGTEAARAFFDRCLRGTGPIALDAELESIGLLVRRRAAQGFEDKGGVAGPSPDAEGDSPSNSPGWLGITLVNGAKLQVAAVREGSPAWRAGVYAGDELLAEGRVRIDRAALWDRLRERGASGELTLTLFRRDVLMEVTVPLAPAPEDTLWLEPTPASTPVQRAAFEAWCGVPHPAVPAAGSEAVPKP